MSTTQTFEQRAAGAGAALRAAFDEGDLMTSTITPAPPSLTAPSPRRSALRLTAAAAAVAAVAVAGAALLLQDEAPPREEVLGGGSAEVVSGLPGAPDYPLRLSVPSSLRQTDQGAGTRGFVLTSGARGGFILSGLRSVDGTLAADLPADVTQVFSQRTDMVVSELDARRVDGRRAQAFTLRAAPGQQPRDLWCAVAGGSCFKVVPDQAMDVLVVETAGAPLWLAAEYAPEARDEVRAALAQVVDGLELPAIDGIAVAGVTLPLPQGWRVDARGERYNQAGDPEKRAVRGVNVVVPGVVVAADGSRSDTPDDLLGWLEARSGLDVQRLQAVDVDGREGTLVRVDVQGSSQTVWCGSAEDLSSCFNTGSGTVLYLLVPFGEETLVLERSTDAAVAADGLTSQELQNWVDAHLDMARSVQLD